MSHPLAPVFEPHAIAVVGASADPAKRGFQILRAMLESGYEGAVHPVNPRGGEILGLPVYSAVTELPDGVDLAVLCTPGASAPDIVRECGRRGIRGALVLAVGFGESGAGGRELEGRLRASASETGVRVVGPNTSGILNLHRGVNLIGARGVRAGGLALLVQSGNIALALMKEVTERSWAGLSIAAGLGNELDVGFAEVLDFLGQHPGTEGIIMHAEGLRDARAVLSVASRVTRHKPVVVIKAARSERGATSALSHTGAVAGPYDRLEAGLRQAGVTVVTRTDELLPVGMTLTGQPLPAPRAGVAILSDGGGQGTLAVDALVEAGVPLSSLGPSTRDALRSLLGSAAAVTNPVDLAGAADGDPLTFARALELLAEDEAVGSVLLVGLFGGYHIRFAEALEAGELDAARAMVGTLERTGKGLVLHSMYAASRSEPLAILGRAGVPVVESLDVACRCVAELCRAGDRVGRRPWQTGGRRTVPPAAARALEALPEGAASLSEPQARELLSGFGVEFPSALLVDDASGAARAWEEIGAPSVVKVVWERIVHKAAAGGVVLDVESAEEARAAFISIERAVSAFASEHGLDAPPVTALLSPMAERPACEFLVGAYRDSQLGPVLTVGLGGSWVEVVREVSHRVLPVSGDDLQDMLTAGRVGALLHRAGAGRNTVAERVAAVAQAVADCIVLVDRVKEVEINPLFVYEDRVVPIDARVILGGA